ncbi:TetR family transcriptional regulator [Halalkaliarchaeum desulfuricum]|uniref:TetR family transcriptional regulator n=1 Tax=Halalkaliarchaeum desulfuricum TaxID=2055893 RepID=A0A343TMI1_9EURY|nr:TetR/AcrR family transcriptional regulator [Halalkaliarchaeum desulfuricum]AUX10303.1 TetR family transcriptional regulator [Halalkaliarchaeum desulfuricum]
MGRESATDEEILEAVDRALRKHGYAKLTMQDIADESSKSKSLLHYHFDTKEDLLVAFLDDLLDSYEQRLECRSTDPPGERLMEFLARFVFAPGDEDREAFHLALLEMRSQGAFNDRIRERLVRSDRLLRTTVIDILEDGIEEGVFEPVDPERTAALLVATLDGARTRQITLGEENDSYTRTVVEELLERVIEPILTEEADLPTIEETLDDPDRQG